MIRTAVILCCSAAAVSAASPDDLLLWFDSPARVFTESLPLGNGRLGAMVFGGVKEERVVLNESSVWSGGRQDADRPDAAQYLPEIRRLLLEGKNAEAEKLTYAHFNSRGEGSAQGHGKDAPYGSYQTLGNLMIEFPSGGSLIRNYRRELNLANAIARVEYEQNGAKIVRETFVSAPDEAIVMRITSDKPGAISFQATLDRREGAETTNDGTASLLMTGRLTNGTDGKGTRYAARLRVLHRGGEISATRNAISICNADEAVLIVTGATDYQGFAGRNVTDPDDASAKDLSKASGRDYATMRAAHIADFQRYFQRSSLTLGPANRESAAKPMPARLKAAAEGARDPGLAALYYQYGRYLLISSSRPGGLPANLQGIWAEEVQAPWNADWHLNVNVQMNYWPAEVTNLTELHQTLFALIASLEEPGSRTAKAYYGARGWVAHVITNPWGYTSPGEAASWGSTTSGSAWLCQHLWDHYLFTRDAAFLKLAYPILKGSAQFYADMIIEEPKHKWLVTAPAIRRRTDSCCPIKPQRTSAWDLRWTCNCCATYSAPPSKRREF